MGCLLGRKFGQTQHLKWFGILLRLLLLTYGTKIKTIYDRLGLGGIIKQSKMLEMHRSEEYDCVAHGFISRVQHRSWHVVSPY